MDQASGKLVLCCWVWLLILSEVNSQIVDSKQFPPYQKVFVATDAFDDTYLDILKTQLDRSEVDSVRFSILNDLAYYWHTRNLKTAAEFNDQGLNETHIAKDSLWHGRFLITQGSILLRQEELDDAETVLKKAVDLVTKEDLAFLYTQMGYVYERRGKLDIAADYAKKSLELGVELHDLKAQALAYSDLSNLFWKQSKFEKGLELGLKSLDLFEERGIDDLDYDFTLYVVGNNYLGLKKFTNALSYFKKSIEIGERYGFYNNLSDIYISLTDLYTDMGHYAQAEEAGQNAIKYAELLNNNFMLMRSHLAMGKLQNSQLKYTEAIESIEKSIEIATADFGDGFFLSQAYEALVVSHSQKGDYKKALTAHQRFTKLKDSVFTLQADQRISELQTEYDVALKEDTIKLQEARIAQQKSRQMLIMVVAGSLFLLLAALFIAFKNNRRKNILLKKQNEEKGFLLKEIHHRVKNNLEIVSSLLLLQSAKLDDEAAIGAMQESQNRVQSMSMIHQRLYQGENLATIEMKDYFINLGNHVLDAFGVQKRVILKCAMDRLNLDVDTAVPLGLIVNELLTNTMKYAFPDEQKGKINISLTTKDAEIMELRVTDNGVGKNNEVIQGSGFGTQLINLLVKQLDGTLEYHTGKGTEVAIQFKFGKKAA
ncbi:tetratricopeptide repeat protein [Flavobacteriaceae bacterium R33]|uniref:histidine kinase n=2 Tax=Poritiphilus flavus TaxID=2697053 RepID=A0A6L9EBI1_9FLAO|nr:tetratricopeptide repeat protein [Poritiphilus flavus]